MATIIASVVLPWQQLPSAVLIFLASTLNVHFRESDYISLAVTNSGLGLVFVCWFATGLLGITLADISAIWKDTETVMVDVMSHTPPSWPMALN